MYSIPLRLQYMKTCWKESELLGNFWVNPGPFTCALAVRAVRMMLVCPTIIPRLRRKPNAKKLKILAKRWSNMQSDHPKQQFYMIFTENKFKLQRDLYWFQLEYGKIRCLCTSDHRLRRVCNFLVSDFFLSQGMMVGHTSVMRTASTANAHVKGPAIVWESLIFLE